MANRKYENEHQLTICRKRRPSKCHTKFSPSRSMHWNCVFRHPKDSSAAAPLCHLKVSIGRCLQPILQMPTPSLKAWSPPSTEINVSLNICSKYFRKHLQHKCQHQISNRTNTFQIFQNIKFLKRRTFTQWRSGTKRPINICTRSHVRTRA